MAHDYKYAAKTSSKSSGGGSPPGWLWFLAGLSVGLFIAVLAYLSAQYSARNSAQHPGAQPRAQTECPEIRPPKPSKPAGAAHPAAAADPDKVKKETQFEFYTILPEREIRVPEHELHPEEQIPGETGPSGPGGLKDNYILQAGSFRYMEDADQLKAALVLNGFDVEIQTVETGNEGTWYRVRLGPYRDLAMLHRIRADLRKSGFSPLVLKEKR